MHTDCKQFGGNIGKPFPLCCRPSLTLLVEFEEQGINCACLSSQVASQVPAHQKTGAVQETGQSEGGGRVGNTGGLLGIFSKDPLGIPVPPSNVLVAPRLIATPLSAATAAPAGNAQISPATPVSPGNSVTLLSGKTAVWSPPQLLPGTSTAAPSSNIDPQDPPPTIPEPAPASLPCRSSNPKNDLARPGTRDSTVLSMPKRKAVGDKPHASNAQVDTNRVPGGDKTVPSSSAEGENPAGGADDSQPMVPGGGDSNNSGKVDTLDGGGSGTHAPEAGTKDGQEARAVRRAAAAAASQKRALVS